MAPLIAPVSDLRNYSSLLSQVRSGRPAFLTKNGRGRYVILDISDFEETSAAASLATKLAAGRRSGEEEGWLSHETVKKRLWEPDHA